MSENLISSVVNLFITGGILWLGRNRRGVLGKNQNGNKGNGVRHKKSMEKSSGVV